MSDLKDHLKRLHDARPAPRTSFEDKWQRSEALAQQTIRKAPLGILALAVLWGLWAWSLPTLTVLITLAAQILFVIFVFDSTRFAILTGVTTLLWPVINLIALGQRLFGMAPESGWMLPYFSVGDYLFALLTPLVLPLMVGGGLFWGTLDSRTDLQGPTCQNLYAAAERLDIDRAEVVQSLWSRLDLGWEIYSHQAVQDYLALKRSRKSVWELRPDRVTSPAYWTARFAGSLGCFPASAPAPS